MTVVVTAGRRYIDIDAYASIIAYAELLNLQGTEALAVSTAVQNESITPTARKVEVELSTKYEPKIDDQFVIVDVSEPELLDKIVRQESVIEVIDHHLGNEAFWQGKARVDIEFIGAACTQIYERWVNAGMVSRMSQTSAKLLSLGILDNTLNFEASICTQRDRDAYNALTQIAQVFDSWAEDYFLECQASAEKDVGQVVKNDTKMMRFPGYDHDVTVGQLVVWNARRLIDKSLELVEANSHFINVISISEGVNYLLVHDEKLRDFLVDLLDATETNGWATTKRLWLRKEIMKQAIDRYSHNRSQL